MLPRTRDLSPPKCLIYLRYFFRFDFAVSSPIAVTVNVRPPTPMKDPTIVLLYELGSLELVVPSTTGVTYRQQLGGHSCLQTDAEGYLVPIAGEVPNATERLRAHFTGGKWGGWCSNGIDDETANIIDQLLADVVRRVHIKVDRSRLGDSWESWIRVEIAGPLLSLVENSQPISAILTWPNSE